MKMNISRVALSCALGMSAGFMFVSAMPARADRLIDCEKATTGKEKAICDSFAGQYENRYGSVVIKKNSRGFDVAIDASDPNRGLWTCEFSGYGQPDVKGTMKVESAAAKERSIVLKKRGDKLTVRGDGLTQTTFCGMGGFIDGEYE